MNLLTKLTISIALSMLLPPASADRNSVDEFVHTFIKAVEARDIDSIILMNEWEGLPGTQQKAIEATFSDVVVKGIAEYRINIIPEGKEIAFEKKGNVFAPNVVPVAQLFIEVNSSEGFRGGYSYYIGESGGGLKFGHVVLKKS